MRKRREGGAADEAAARRKLRACPLADAKAAGFVKRPSQIQRAFGLEDEGTGRTKEREFRKFCPAEGRSSDRAPPPAKAGSFGSGAASGRTGLRPGSCEPGGTQDASPWTCQAEPSALSRKDPAGSKAGLRSGGGKAGTEGFGSRSAKRRTARASALTGSPRGTGRRASARRRTPETGIGTPGSDPVSKPPARDCLASQAGCHPRRDSGGRRRRRPPLSFRGRSAADSSTGSSRQA